MPRARSEGKLPAWRSDHSRAQRTTGRATRGERGTPRRSQLIASPPRSRPSALGQAEPVAGVVFEQRLDAVRPLTRLLLELDPTRLELLVGLLAVGRLEDAGAHIAPLDEAAELRADVLGHHHAGADGHQD